MASINISLKKEAYDFLNSLKGRDKSFSEVILEFKEGRKGSKEVLLSFAGCLKDKKDWDDFKKNTVEFRKSFDKRLS